MIREFISKTCSQYLSLWDSIKVMIIKVDLAKIILLKYKPGFYADMDMECLHNVEHLLEGYDLVFAQTYNEIPQFVCTFARVKYHGKLRINNAFMASMKYDHPFWGKCLDKIRTKTIYLKPSKYFYPSWIACICGPELICRILYKDMINFPDVYKNTKIYHFSYFEPKRIKHSKNPDRNISEYKIEPHSACVHYYAKSWLSSDKTTMREIWVVAFGLILGIIVILGITAVVSITVALRVKRRKFLKKNQEKINFKS